MHTKMNDLAKKVLCITAGGSGGHLIPTFELAKQWLVLNPEGRVVLFTTTKKIDDLVIQQYSIINRVIRFNLPTISSRRFWAIPDLLIKSMFAFVRSFYTFVTIKPVKIISSGGFVSIPVCFAARLCRVPIELYELNAVPGKAIKLLARLATRTIITFAESEKFFKPQSCSYQPYPIRFSEHDKIVDKHVILEAINQQASTNLPFSSYRKTIFLLGGSQGSVKLNRKLKDFLVAYPNMHEQVQIIHQTGARDQTDWSAFYKSYNIPAVIFNYTHTIECYYQLADLVITRAGAGTLFELLFFQKNSLIIPLITHTTDHQKDNAYAIAHAHQQLFTVMEHSSIDQNPILLYQKILRLVNL